MTVNAALGALDWRTTESSHKTDADIKGSEILCSYATQLRKPEGKEHEWRLEPNARVHVTPSLPAVWP